MKIDCSIGAMFVLNIGVAESLYTKKLDREPDDRPMGTLAQWRSFGSAVPSSPFIERTHIHSPRLAWVLTKNGEALGPMSS